MKIYQVQVRCIGPYMDPDWQNMYAPFQKKENAQEFINKQKELQEYGDSIWEYEFRIKEDFIWFGDTPGYEEYLQTL